VELDSPIDGCSYTIKSTDQVKKDLRRMPGASGLIKVQTNLKYVDMDLAEVNKA